MKKVTKFLALVIATMLCATLFVACSKVTQDYADKINEAAKNGNHYTYDQVMKDLGDGVLDATLGTDGFKSGIVTAVKGCKTKEDVEAKMKSGESYEVIVITFLADKATLAKYEKIEAKE